MVSKMMEEAESIREQHMIAALEEIEKILGSPCLPGCKCLQGKVDKIREVINYWRNPPQYATGARKNTKLGSKKE
jgi:hypothetical protein